MKVGILRCTQTEDYCPGTTCFKLAQAGKGSFEAVGEPIEVIGFVNCGGCPGKKSLLRAREMVKRGAEAIVFASCIQKGTPIGFPCPHAQQMRDMIAKDLGDSVKILDYTH